MKTKAKAILCLVILTSATSSDVHTPKWVATKNKDGISAFVGKAVNPKITPTKVEMSVSVSPERVVNVIKDLSNYHKWVPHCTKSYTIETVSDTVSYGYQRISAPMIKDRDVAVRLTVRKISNKNYEVLITAVPNFIKPEPSALRIQHLIVRYHVYETANNLTHVEQESEVDIGGSIPSFLLNWSLKNQPQETFQNLRKEILNS